MTPKPTWTWTWALIALLGCSGKPDIIADLDDDAGDPGDAGSAAVDAAVAALDGRVAPGTGPRPEPGARAAFCAGQGSVVATMSGGGPAWTAARARSLHSCFAMRCVPATRAGLAPARSLALTSRARTGRRWRTSCRDTVRSRTVSGRPGSEADKKI